MIEYVVALLILPGAALSTLHLYREMTRYLRSKHG